jgi:hypothetical protein
VERYGAQFLEIIGNYTSANGLESRMTHFTESKKQKKRKK